MFPLNYKFLCFTHFENIGATGRTGRGASATLNAAAREVCIIIWLDGSARNERYFSRFCTIPASEGQLG